VNNITEVAFLGPEGTYSHIIAKKHYGDKVKGVPLSSIMDICSFAAESPNRRGLVPVENSSGGPIPETIDILIYNKFNLLIEESISLNIKLALLGKKEEKIETLYSHSVPLFHCDSWIRKNMPTVNKITVSSTARAAKQAAIEKNAAAIASPDSAEIYNLNILKYPIEQDVPNITQFYSLALSPCKPSGRKIRTSISAFLKNEPGSLYDFLKPFKTEKVNLSRIISRPIYGKPSEYAFFVDIDGNSVDQYINNTISKIRQACSNFRIIGSYPVDKIYDL
jgi:chorismate mutase / prephenate dehydratase